MKKGSIAAIVLAGGQSSRFGTDKALFDFQGRPLIAYVLDIFSGLASRIIVSISPGKTAAFRETLGDSFELVEDDSPYQGPLVALGKAVEFVSESFVMLAPCDMPFLDRALYNLLLMRIEERDAAMPVLNNYREPITAVYKTAALKTAVKKAVSKDERKLSSILEYLDIAVVSELELLGAGIDRISFININARF